MNHKTRRLVETLACERRYGIADAKGAEYSGAGSTYQETGADTLNNFKSVASRIGGTPEQVLMTYLLKHIDSINTTVREAAETTDPGLNVYPKGEGIVSRLDDARNYLDLLECLLIDNGHIEAPSPEVLVDPKEGADDDDTYTLTDEGVEIAEQLVRAKAEGTLRENLIEAGLVECLDGVWRPAAKKDESVKHPGEVQTPIYAQPTMDQVRESLRYGETGEL